MAGGEPELEGDASEDESWAEDFLPGDENVSGEGVGRRRVLVRE